eukprot:TRINITY_DN2438_c0_g1_i24.p1 TRINITY_DN2438_c0_g1~~TRINITY_DN2438_c0_g1_i24.p1  ORF type:complete len:525 (+),score=96.07 TRINITY_DN2438_c0_g1_i24:130-1575(+)
MEANINTLSYNSRSEVTINEAYDMSGGHGKYQFMVAIAISIVVFTNLFYLFSIPLFLIFPVVLDERGNRFLDADAACASNYYYQDKEFNYVTEYDLLCNSFKASIISSVFQIGFMVASLTLSNVTDRIGRVPIFLLGQCGIVISLAGIVLLNTYTACLICTGLCGFFCFLPLCYTFAYDSTNSRYVEFYSSYIGIMYAVGQILVVGVMWLGFKWRAACVFMIALCLVFFIFPWFMEESPRYKYSKGRINAAIKTFKRISKFNGKEFPHSIVLWDVSETSAKAINLCEQLKLLFQRYIVTRLVICGFLFFTCGFIYYGFSLNVHKFIGDTYLNALFNAIAEIVGVSLAFVLSRLIGIRLPLLISYIITGCALVVQHWQEDSQIVTNCAMYVGKFSISCSFTMVYMLGGQLFPTSISTTCLALLALCERLGAILSPVIGDYKTIFMAMSIICALVAAFAVIVLYVTLRKKESNKSYSMTITEE